MIETVLHNKISLSTAVEIKKTDMVVISDWKDVQNLLFNEETIYIWRVPKDDFFNHSDLVIKILEKVVRLNIIITKEY